MEANPNRFISQQITVEKDNENDNDKYGGCGIEIEPERKFITIFSFKVKNILGSGDIFGEEIAETHQKS